LLGDRLGQRRRLQRGGGRWRRRGRGRRRDPLVLVGDGGEELVLDLVAREDGQRGRGWGRRCGLRRRRRRGSDGRGRGDCRVEPSAALAYIAVPGEAGGQRVDLLPGLVEELL